LEFRRVLFRSLINESVSHSKPPGISSAKYGDSLRISSGVSTLNFKPASFCVSTHSFAVSISLSLSQTRILPCTRRSEEHTSELKSRVYIVCRRLLEK